MKFRTWTTEARMVQEQVPGRGRRSVTDERPIFLLCARRTGSTMLQRYCNCLDGVTIWGEHCGVLRELVEIERKLNSPIVRKWIERSDSEGVLNHRTITGPGWTTEWANDFTPEQVTEYCKRFAHALLGAGCLTPRWGFKEILYREAEYEALKRWWPEARFIFLLRDPHSALISTWVNNGGDAQLKERFDELLSYYQFVRRFGGSESALVLSYERLAEFPSPCLTRIVEHTGATIDMLGATKIWNEPPSRNADYPEAKFRIAMEMNGLDEQVLTDEWNCCRGLVQ